MRLTARYSRGRGRPTGVARGMSIPAPVGGWDAISPLASMPPENAVELVNWFPQPGYVEVRRGYAEQCDTGTGDPVDTVMAYHATTTANNRLFAITDGRIFNVTSSTPAQMVTGLTNSRWQHVNFTTPGGVFLWACNGLDAPRYYNGVSWTTTNITGAVTGPELIHCTVYRSRIWAVVRNSTKAAYLATNAVDGVSTIFEVGENFTKGGQLQAIGTWSTDTTDGPSEYIAFISSRGEIAFYLITDPSQASGISFAGKATVGSPIGRRCFARMGSDLAVICIDGVIPISQAISYDRAALLGQALTKNIQPVVTEAARLRQTVFGWQILSYPRSNMAILNVPITEGTEQEQFVMNTITGAWCRFRGQHANAWDVYEDRAYFGGNDGIVYLADEAGIDASGMLEADMRGAFNYYGARGHQKRWTMIRPVITSDGQVEPELAFNVDFSEDAPLSAGSGFFSNASLWDVALWDVDLWSALAKTQAQWRGVSGIGYCASVRMRVQLSTGAPVEPVVLQVNSFDVLMEDGSFI